jgi:mycoredoxin-dependent peroxiredoxin
LPVNVGDKAPDFSLKDQQNNTVTLEDLKGQKALVVFIPFPYTGHCNNEACALRDDFDSLKELGAQVVIINVHAAPYNRKWAEEHELPFPVLSDFWPHGAVAQAFGSFNDQIGTAMRVSYVLDKDGVVREIIRTDSLGQPREHAAYAEALSKID